MVYIRGKKKEMTREQELIKLTKSISKNAKRLLELGYSYEDKASIVVLFDDSLTQLDEEDRHIGTLLDGLDKYPTTRG